MQETFRSDQRIRRPHRATALRIAAWTTMGAATLVAPSAFADSAMMKLISIMHDNGSISDDQYAQLQAAAEQEDQNANGGGGANNTRTAVASPGASNPNVATPAENALTPTQGNGPVANNQGQGQNQGSQKRLSGTNAGSDIGMPSTVENENQTAFRKHVEEQFDELSWLTNLNLTGDLRLRYEHSNDTNALADVLGAGLDRQDRDRARLRFRLGTIFHPVDHIEVGGGIATGGDDPRSTNQTLGDDFSSKPIRLDYAYAQGTFGDHFSAIGGKFKFGNYLWTNTDLIWDGDINPEGASVHFENKDALGTSFFNSGLWVLQEFSQRSSDPFLYYSQAGQHFDSSRVFGSLAATYYGYVNDEAMGVFVPDYSAGTNTPGAQFSVVDVDGQLGTKFSNGTASLVGEYVKNVHQNTVGDTGYAFGTQVAWDRWAMKYLYGDLDRDVVPDTFPDSDRFSGATAIKGHEVAISYTLQKRIALSVDYYNVESKLIDEDQSLVQGDIVFSF